MAVDMSIGLEQSMNSATATKKPPAMEAGGPGKAPASNMKRVGIRKAKPANSAANVVKKKVAVKGKAGAAKAAGAGSASGSMNGAQC